MTQMQTEMMKELSPDQRRTLLTILKDWREDPERKTKRHKKKSGQ